MPNHLESLNMQHTFGNQLQASQCINQETKRKDIWRNIHELSCDVPLLVTIVIECNLDAAAAEKKDCQPKTANPENQIVYLFETGPVDKALESQT